MMPIILCDIGFPFSFSHQCTQIFQELCDAGHREGLNADRSTALSLFCSIRNNYFGPLAWFGG